MEVFRSLSGVRSVEDAIAQFRLYVPSTPKVELALKCAETFHRGQVRRSGMPYVTHPICVSVIVAAYGGDESMVCAALLHDIVEDTLCSIEHVYEHFGESVGDIVDALTKIVEIRNEELQSGVSDDKSVVRALSFRKMLLASVKDARVLAIKIFDRMHNMLTLDALPSVKQTRVAEETLVVYAPIAHRLGISSIKNKLEDLSFYYILPDEYKKIEAYMQKNRQSLELRLNQFTHTIQILLENEGFLADEFEIQSRVKRPYSMYLKKQRKGIDPDDMLDLLAVRIILRSSVDCYRALGIIHLNLKPIPSRLKDYIAIPKENGYQTIHTTVFDNSSVYEVQIRTFDMHKSAEYGMAAHWKYKSGGMPPRMDWLQNMQYARSDVEEFYELARNDLYNEDVVVFSPLGDIFSLPYGAVALDFAYAVHSKLGDAAKEAYVNHQKASLLHTLKSGDIVKIVAGDRSHARCGWIDSVKTSKAKSHMKNMCQNKIKEVDRKSGINIIATVLNRDAGIVERVAKEHKLEDKMLRVPYDLSSLREVRHKVGGVLEQDGSFFSKIKFSSYSLREHVFDRLIIYSNRNIRDVTFDHCCHPKHGDPIVALRLTNKVAVVHQKLCDQANEQIGNGADQFFVEWANSAKAVYKMIVGLEDKVGSMSGFLSALSKYGCNVLSIHYDGYRNGVSSLCEVLFEISRRSNIKAMKYAISKGCKIIDFSSLKDAYCSSGL